MFFACTVLKHRDLNQSVDGRAGIQVALRLSGFSASGSFVVRVAVHRLLLALWLMTVLAELYSRGNRMGD